MFFTYVAVITAYIQRDLGNLASGNKHPTAISKIDLQDLSIVHFEVGN